MSFVTKRVRMVWLWYGIVMLIGHRLKMIDVVLVAIVSV